MSSTSATPTISRRRLAAGAAWAVPTVTLAGAAPAFAGSFPTGETGGLCYTVQSGSTVNNANMFLHFYVGTTTDIAAGQGSWTYYVTLRFANSSDYGAFTNPWNTSYGGFNGSTVECSSDSTTLTRTFRVSLTNATALSAGYATCNVYIYTGNNSGVKPSTQISVASVESGTDQRVVYNETEASPTWPCSSAGTSVPTTPPTSGCCNWQGTGARAFQDTSQDCSTVPANTCP